MRVKDSSVGTAYCFFEYHHERSIEQSLSYLRKGAEIPPETVLEVIVGIENVNTIHDIALTDMILQVPSEMTHVLKASLQGSSNRRVANIVGDVMNAVYQDLCDAGESPYMTILYERGEKYVMKRK